MSDCSRQHSQYLYQACAYGLAGDMVRPTRHNIPTQATAVLAAGGGRSFQRVDNFRFDGVVSFDSAQVEVGGSFDECHKIHTSYGSSVIENLNIADVVKADKVVFRMVAYSPEVGKDGEHRFDITGSHFENLRVAGRKIDVELATSTLSKNDTFSKFAEVYRSDSSGKLLVWGHQDDDGFKKLASLESDYHALKGISSLIQQWKQRQNQDVYWASAAGGLNLKKQIGESELEQFGSIICIPKFGIVRLAELKVQKNCLSLHMIRVQMCSSSDGSIDGGGGHGGGTTYP